MNIFLKISDTRRSAILFIAALVFTYSLVPFALDTYFFKNEYFYNLGWICLVGCFALAIGFNISILDERFRSDSKRLVINDTVFHTCIWIVFIVFMVIVFTTAKSIPLLLAFSDASAEELSQARGAFLKGRIGLESAFLYISTIFVSTLLPYSVVQLFINRSKWRYYLASIFFIFSISFLQKALFLNLILPLIYYASQRLKISRTKIFSILIAIIVFLYLASAISKGSDEEVENYGPATDVETFFSAEFHPSNTSEMLVWRIVAVPIFTATDTLLVFDQQFHEKHLFGATSSLISTLFLMENVNIERIVFAHQFGNWNDIANANAVFLVDAYVNFGWIGVCFFSLFIGQSLRWFYKSQDEAFKSLWLIYCFGLFSASLIGMMLSNGYSLLFFYALFVRLQSQESHV